MIVRDRQGNEYQANDDQDHLVRHLYSDWGGRLLLRMLVRPWVSRAAGLFMDSPLSSLLISSFVKKNNIDLTLCEQDHFATYNDFFTRKFKTGTRFVDMDPQHLVSPCDAKLAVYPITQNAKFCIKDTAYTLQSLLRSESLASRYLGGQILVFRLTVDDYHRYCYPVTGRKSREVQIPGVYHTVNPAANDALPIYKENAREYCLIQNQIFGTMLMMEVGALLVGRIVNHEKSEIALRGKEKGYFAFGGSTVILLLQRDTAIVDTDILMNSAEGIETVVRLGEKIGDHELSDRTGS